MFPNFRLMLVAMLASIVAVGCGFGLFAALRVNHQPFTRLANENPPLQLVFDHTTPAAQPTSFGVRFEPGGSPIAGAGPARPAVALARPEANPAVEAAPTAETGVKNAPKQVRQRKVARRAREPRAAAAVPAADQNFTAAQAGDQWTPQGQAAAPVKHRAPARRHDASPQ